MVGFPISISIFIHTTTASAPTASTQSSVPQPSISSFNFAHAAEYFCVFSLV